MNTHALRRLSLGAGLAALAAVIALALADCGGRAAADTATATSATAPARTATPATATTAVARTATTAAATTGATATAAPQPRVNYDVRIPSASGPASLRVGAASSGPAVPDGFVGLATEYWDVERLAGDNPAAPDVPFEHLLTALSPGGAPSLRIGGDSTDWTWWPIAGKPKPPWVHYTLTPQWTSVVRKLAADTSAKLLLGVNFEADQQAVANLEVKELVKRIGGSSIGAFELGNEPELYGSFPFYEVGARKITGRARTYAWSHIAPDWARIAAGLPRTRAQLAGPGWAMPNALPFTTALLKASRRLKVLTLHTYPLKSPRCNGGHPITQGDLFQPAALSGLAGEVGAWVRTAGRYGATLRTDEMNSITCNGEKGISETFGPALWTLNILPELAAAGDGGVNFDFEPISAQHLITAKQTASGWRVAVQPTYYGLLAFSQLAPKGSHMIGMGKVPAGLLAWADKTPGGKRNVVVTNIGAHTRAVTIAIPGAHAPASVSLLRAPGGLKAAAGVTLGGQSISATTGQLAGTPHVVSVKPGNGAYRITVPAASAAIVAVQ